VSRPFFVWYFVQEITSEKLVEMSFVSDPIFCLNAGINAQKNGPDLSGPN
jgi:hypothetical protein